jgi:GH15 family glucan-1,4-alpha-glucosidase
MDGPAEDWRRLRRDIFEEVCEHGYDADRGTFTQYYGSGTVDAALLLIPAVGFLPAGDRRVRGTVAAVERQLCRDGLVQRYDTSGGSEDLDGLPPGEGAFLACTFWLADCHILRGDVDRGRRLLERLLGLANDVGLLSEEYDPERRRMLGNFPQALSHLSLVNTALNLEHRGGPAHQRAIGRPPRNGRPGEG